MRSSRPGADPKRASALGLLRWLAVASVLTLIVALFGFRSEVDGEVLLWPAAGVAAGVILLTSGTERWAAAAGVLIALAASDTMRGHSPAEVAVLAGGQVAQALLVARGLELTTSGQVFRLDRARNVAAFLAVAIIVSASAGLVVGVGLTAVGSHPDAMPVAWAGWAASNAVGIIAVTPAVLLLGRRPPASPELRAEDVAMVAALGAAAFVVLGTTVPQTSILMLVTLTLLAPLALWAVLRANLTGAAGALALVAAIALWSSADRGLLAEADWPGRALVVALAAALLTLGARNGRRPRQDALWLRPWRETKDERALVVLVPLMLLAAFSWWSWRGTFDQAQETALRQTELLAEHAERVLETQHALLKAALARARDRTPDSLAADREIHQFLAELERLSNTSTSVSLVDPATGRILSDNRRFPAPALDLSDREYVAAHRDRAILVHIGPVIRAKASGRVGFTVSRRDPTTGLIAVSLVPPEIIRSAYGRLPEHDRDNAMLAREDGVLLVRRIDVSDPVGFRLPPNGLFYKFLSGEIVNGSIHRSAIDGHTRLVSQLKVGDFPVYVGYGIDVGKLRAHWLGDVAPFTLLALASSLALWMLTSRLQRTAFDAAEARAQARRDQRYHTLVDASGAVVWSCPPSGKQVALQPEWMAFTGQSPQEVLGNGWSSVVHPEDIEAVVAAWQESVATGTPYHGEYRIRRRDGEWRWMRVHAAPIREADGHVSEWFGMCIDVADRRKAEELLLQSRERLAFMLELSDALRLLADPDEIIGAACRLLAVRLDVDRAYFVEIDEATGVRRVVKDFVRGGAPSLAGDHRTSEFGWSVDILRRGACHVVDDTQSSEIVPPGDRPACAALGIIACIGTPLLKSGRLVGALCAAKSVRRDWKDGEVDIVRDVGERIWAAVERARAEAALRERESQLRQAMLAADAGTWKVFPESGSFFASDRALALHGLPPGTRMSHDLALERVHPDDRARVEQAMRRSLATGEPFRLELRALRADGRIRWVATFAERRQEGGRVSLAGLVQDITERKEAEQRLAESEERLRLATAAGGIGTFAIDLRSGIAHYSPELSEMLGFPDVCDAPVESALNRVHRADQARVRSLYAASLEPGGEGRLDMELRFVRPGGEVRWMSWSGRVYFEMQGGEQTPSRFVGVCIDITGRKLDEERLRASHDTFRHLVERSPFGIYVIDADFRLVQVSEGARKVFENVRPQIRHDFAQVLRTIWEEPLASEAIERFRHTLATGEPYHSPSTVGMRADAGVTEAYDWKIARIALPDGRPGVVCHFYDLSERQRNEERIKLLMRELNHRSKNLLGLVGSIARHTAASSPEEFLMRFDQRIQSLAAAQDLLVKHAWEAVPLVDLVRSQLAHFADLIDERVAISGPALSVVPAASQALGMAFHELATNAAKYGALSNGTGRIRIAWELDAGSGQGPELWLTWREEGGPTVAAPQRRGFGTTVTTSMVEMSLGGKVTTDYAPAGLVWRLACPATSVACEPPRRTSGEE